MGWAPRRGTGFPSVQRLLGRMMTLDISILAINRIESIDGRKWHIHFNSIIHNNASSCTQKGVQCQSSVPAARDNGDAGADVVVDEVGHTIERHVLSKERPLHAVLAKPTTAFNQAFVRTRPDGSTSSKCLGEPYENISVNARIKCAKAQVGQRPKLENLEGILWLQPAECWRARIGHASERSLARGNPPHCARHGLHPRA